jgi:hypothetical protein
MTIRADGQMGTGPRLRLGTWHTLDFAWDLSAGGCRVRVDGHPALMLKQRNVTGNGVSYLHLRSRAQAIDPAGFLIESVSVDIDRPVAPERTDEEKRMLLDRYLPSYYLAPPERQPSSLDVE